MKKSCRYCGGVHERGYVCERKPVPKKKYNDHNSFRNTSTWRRTREWVKIRDSYLCQACLHKLQGTITQYNDKDLEVHHIVPLSQSYDLRMDYDNLITLCVAHHELADQRVIAQATLKEIACKNNSSVL